MKILMMQKHMILNIKLMMILVNCKKEGKIGIRIMIIDEELAKYNDESSESSSDDTDSSEDVKPKKKSRLKRIRVKQVVEIYPIKV